MNEQDRMEHINKLLSKSSCKAEAFQILSIEHAAHKIVQEDYLAMAEMLGFPIYENERLLIGQSLRDVYLNLPELPLQEALVQKHSAKA